MPMNKQATDQTDRETVSVEIPKVLYERVCTFCEEKNTPTGVFLIDAIGEHLQRSYKEKRRRPRL